MWMALTASIATIATAGAVMSGPTTPKTTPPRQTTPHRQDEVLPGSGSGTLPEVGVEHGMGGTGGSRCDGNIRSEYWCASFATPEACATDDDIKTQCADDCCGIETCDDIQNVYANDNYDYWCSTRATPEACSSNTWVLTRCARDCCGIIEATTAEPGMSPQPVACSQCSTLHPTCCVRRAPCAHPATRTATT